MVKKTEAMVQDTEKDKSNEKGESAFPCFRCGICCTRYQIFMSFAEARIIAEKIGISLDAFVDYYLDPRWPDRETIVVRNVMSACPFLDQPESSVFGLCRIHEVKPFCCRQWQASLSGKECRQGLNRYWGLSVDENGKLNGSPEDILCFQAFINFLNEEEKA